jgi:hypothetical protein
VKVGDLVARSVSGSTEISADLDGYRVWFRFHDDDSVAAWGGPFLVAALPEAMARGERLLLDASAPVSPTLLRHVDDIQAIYHCWNPDLKPVAVECTVSEPPPPRPGVMAFTSGGLDSAYTLVRHRTEITHFVHLLRFDYRGEEAVVAERLRRLNEMAGAFGAAFRTVETNYRTYAEDRKLMWLLVHGNCLAAVALIFGFQRAYIPSSHTYRELFPWGSHPLIDPLWSNGRTEIIHDGAGQTRVEKLREIASFPAAMEHLAVCWRNPVRNCGECPKCIRTKISLHLLGLSSPNLPPLRSLKELKGLSVHDRNERAFLEENLALAREVGDRAMERKLLSILRGYQVEVLLGEVDRVLLGHSLRKIYRKMAKPEWLEQQATLESTRT